MNKKLKIVLIIFLFAIVWFYRETTFIYTNALISELQNKTGNGFKMFAGLGFLKHCDLRTLLMLKWVFTIIYVIVFWLLCLLMVKWFYNTAIHYKLTHIIYLSVPVLSFVVYTLSHLINGGQEYGYMFSRHLLGAAQSPLIAMLLISVFLIHDNKS
jgi:hypothetical protein